jgi:OmpA family
MDTETETEIEIGTEPEPIGHTGHTHDPAPPPGEDRPNQDDNHGLTNLSGLNDLSDLSDLSGLNDLSDLSDKVTDASEGDRKDLDPPSNPAAERSSSPVVSPPPRSERSSRRVKLSPQTLRQRTTIGEFVEPLEPTPAPPRIKTPPLSTPPEIPLEIPLTSASIPRPAPPAPPRPSPDPSRSSASSAIVPVSETRLAQLEARLIELESQFDFSEIAGSKEKQTKLMPLIDEILSSLTPTALRQETIRSIIPVIDRIIIERSEQNRDAMSAAISDLMPRAIARQIESDPCAIAAAVAPEMAEAIRRQIALKKGVLAEAISSEMGEAIRRQILLAREEMVDALYPVIGNTITKYMSEEIRNINAKVEQSFSLEGMTRKIRAKLQGVSEAELILRDAASFTVKAAFLIHKESGLVIAEAQQPNVTPLESDMIGGMLTAIRSFANDCIAQADAGNTAELNEIEYDTFKLVLEVAGYCYVALVVKGAITKSYVNHMRLVMVGLVQDYGPAIKDFDGDPSTIPDEIAIKIASLVPEPIDLSQEHAKNAKHPPALLILLILGVLGGVIFWARQSWQKRVEATVLQKIDRVPELTAYQIDIEAKGNRLELAGDLPSRSLQEKLIAVVTPLVPDREIVDRTQLTTFEPDEATISAEVDRLTALLNRTLPATVVTQYQNRRITLKGWAEDETVLAAIGNAFEAIPGVQSVSSALLIDAPPDKIRLYFELGETNPIAIGERKLESVERFLREFPNLHLDIIGHADRIGSTEQNRALSQARADRIRQLLINRGISADRLRVRGSLELPPGIDPQQSLDLSRCVRFEIRDRDPAVTETAP